MPSSPRCPSCGYKALRFRKRTHDLVCRRCKEQFPATRTNEALDSVESQAQNNDFFAAVSEVEATANEIFKNNGPPLALILFLSLATAVLVFIITVQTWPWYGALASAVAVSLLILLLLISRSIAVWRKEHPLLARYVEMKLTSPLSYHFSKDAIQLYVDVVSTYLSDVKVKNLLRRLNKV